MKLTDNSIKSNRAGVQPNTFGTVKETAASYFASFFRGQQVGQSKMARRVPVRLVQDVQDDAQWPSARLSHFADGATLRTVSTSIPRGGQLPETTPGAECIIASQVGSARSGLGDVAPSDHFTTTQRVELADRVGCGRGVRLSELLEIKQQTCGNGEAKRIDPASRMKARILTPGAFIFSTDRHQSGRGRGALPHPQYIQWMHVFGKFNVPESVNRGLKQLGYGQGHKRATVLRDIKGQLQSQLQVTGALDHAVERLTSDFQGDDLERELIEPYGDHVVMGGLVGVAGFVPDQPCASAGQRSKMVTENPEQWTLQSARLEPIVKFLSERAIDKLAHQSAGREFLASQQGAHREAAGARRLVDIDWIT